jgi:hypothetical protein
MPPGFPGGTKRTTGMPTKAWLSIYLRFLGFALKVKAGWR